MIASGFSKDPINKLQNWHSGAVRQKQEETQKAKEALYGDTVERFEQAFDRISKLDGSQAALQVDQNKKPGEVDVIGVGSLKKTADGFILETFKMLPTFSPIGIGFQMGSFIPRSNMERETFTVDTTKRTIRHEVKVDNAIDPGFSPFPQLGQTPFNQGFPNYITSTTRDVTINTENKTVDAKMPPPELGWLLAE